MSVDPKGLWLESEGSDVETCSRGSPCILCFFVVAFLCFCVFVFLYFVCVCVCVCLSCREVWSKILCNSGRHTFSGHFLLNLNELGTKESVAMRFTV